MTLSTLGDAQYIALETFRKNGTGVITPVWVAGENGSLFVWTDADSWK
ncbi:MAG: PPOX class F420-dependent oxidoreductase, partial [Chloroflexi bacterium]